MLAFSGEYPSIMYNEMDNGLPGTQYIQNVDAPSCESIPKSLPTWSRPFLLRATPCTPPEPFDAPTFCEARANDYGGSTQQTPAHPIPP
jgi:hypothetical protein